MNLVYNSTEFLELLDKFQKACDNKKYTERCGTSDEKTNAAEKHYTPKASKFAIIIRRGVS